MEHLNLSGCLFITEVGLQELVSVCPSLKDEHFYYCDNINGNTSRETRRVIKATIRNLSPTEITLMKTYMYPINMCGKFSQVCSREMKRHTLVTYYIVQYLEKCLCMYVGCVFCGKNILI